MFWICDGNNADNTGMFELLLCSSYNRVKASSPSQPTSEEAGGDTAGAADPNPPKGYSRPLTHYAQNKKLGKEVKWDILSDHVCFLKSVRHRWRPAFLETSEHLSVCGKW